MFHFTAGQPSTDGSTANNGAAQGNAFSVPANSMVLQQSQAAPASSSSPSSSSGSLFQFVPYPSSSLPQYPTAYSMPTQTTGNSMMRAPYPPQPHPHTAVYLPAPTTAAPSGGYAQHSLYPDSTMLQQQFSGYHHPRLGTGSPAGSSVTHSSQHSPVNEPPPCDHNNWDNLRAKHSIVTLCCRDCQQKWKQQFPIRNLCPEFHGRLTCAFGANCPFLHVHRFKSVHKSPDPPGHVAGMARDRIYAEVAAIVLQENPGKEPHEVVDEVEERVAAAKERKRQQNSSTFSGAAASLQPSSDEAMGSSDLSMNSIQTVPTPLLSTHQVYAPIAQRESQNDDQGSTENSRTSQPDASRGNASRYLFASQAVPMPQGAGIEVRHMGTTATLPNHGGMWSFPGMPQQQQQQQYVAMQQQGGGQQQIVFLQGGAPQDARAVPGMGGYQAMPIHPSYYPPQQQGGTLHQGLHQLVPPGYVYQQQQQLQQQQQQQAFQAVQLPNGQIVFALVSPGWSPQQGNNAQ